MALAIDARSTRLRLLAQRGEGQQEVAGAEQLVAGARETGVPSILAVAFMAAAQVLLAHGQPQEAKALLAELDRVPAIRADPYYGSLLPELVRCAFALAEAELAARLVDGVESRTPLNENALCACRAQLAEAFGGQAEAAVLYAEAADRWQEFGNVPERAYALLGQGRCLLALGRPGAEVPLAEARELFDSIGYKPALAETDALLARTAAAAL